MAKSSTIVEDCNLSKIHCDEEPINLLGSCFWLQRNRFGTKLVAWDANNRRIPALNHRTTINYRFDNQPLSTLLVRAWSSAQISSIDSSQKTIWKNNLLVISTGKRIIIWFVCCSSGCEVHKAKRERFFGWDHIVYGYNIVSNRNFLCGSRRRWSLLQRFSLASSHASSMWLMVANFFLVGSHWNHFSEMVNGSQRWSPN